MNIFEFLKFEKLFNGPMENLLRRTIYMALQGLLYSVSKDMVKKACSLKFLDENVSIDGKDSKLNYMGHFRKISYDVCFSFRDEGLKEVMFFGFQNDLQTLDYLSNEFLSPIFKDLLSSGTEFTRIWKSEKLRAVCSRTPLDVSISLKTLREVKKESFEDDDKIIVDRVYSEFFKKEILKKNPQVKFVNNLDTFNKLWHLLEVGLFMEITKELKQNNFDNELAGGLAAQIVMFFLGQENKLNDQVSENNKIIFNQIRDKILPYASNKLASDRKTRELVVYTLRTRMTFQYAINQAYAESDEFHRIEKLLTTYGDGFPKEADFELYAKIAMNYYEERCKNLKI